MARRRKGQPVSGWIVLDKPAGMTSTQAVAAVRRLLNAQKAGHAGTLDPLATGVLPIALGEATKTIPHVVDARKVYRFTVRWGSATDTDDSEGRPVASSDVRPGRAAIAAALPAFEGEIRQVPPRYSAIKVDGERAYDLARAGETVELVARPVTVHRLALEALPDRDRAELVMECGKGAYVRSLARDLAVALGTVGHVEKLRRIAVGPFHEAAAISLECLQGLGHSAAASKHLLPVETALADIPALALTEAEASRLRTGQSVGLLRRSDLNRIGTLEDGALVCATADGRLVAIARYESGEVKPVRVLHL
jgi:tRNA pseudouridine55 synthase